MDRNIKHCSKYATIRGNFDHNKSLERKDIKRRAQKVVKLVSIVIWVVFS